MAEKEIPMNPQPPNVVTQAPLLGPKPATILCPSCGATITSKVTTKPSTQTHLLALLLCCICICLTFIPYVVDSCQSADHYCPNCEAYLGTYKR